MPGYSRPPSYIATNITLTPVGTIEATNLQAAVQELDLAASEAGLNTFLLIGA